MKLNKFIIFIIMILSCCARAETLVFQTESLFTNPQNPVFGIQIGIDSSFFASISGSSGQDIDFNYVNEFGLDFGDGYVNATSFSISDGSRFFGSNRIINGAPEPALLSYYTYFLLTAFFETDNSVRELTVQTFGMQTWPCNGDCYDWYFYFRENGELLNFFANNYQPHYLAASSPYWTYVPLPPALLLFASSLAALLFKFSRKH